MSAGYEHICCDFIEGIWTSIDFGICEGHSCNYLFNTDCGSILYMKAEMSSWHKDCNFKEKIFTIFPFVENQTFAYAWARTGISAKLKAVHFEQAV